MEENDPLQCLFEIADLIRSESNANEDFQRSVLSVLSEILEQLKLQRAASDDIKGTLEDLADQSQSIFQTLDKLAYKLHPPSFD